jgi:hypothetical protein
LGIGEGKMTKQPNLVYTYNNFLMNHISYAKRKEMFGILQKLVSFENLQQVLDVGATADKLHPESNYFEQFYPYKEHITALSNQDAKFLETQYPGSKFVQGNGLNMPFKDKSFDLVFSSAVLEHVGSFEEQCKFFKECLRVSKKYVFLTTPNRFYPIEFHTYLPFIHWLPKKIHRKILNLIGQKALALEENLNLLSKRTLKTMLDSCLKNSDFNAKILNVKLLGITSNWLLFAFRDGL